MSHHVPEYDADELYAAASSTHSTHKNMQEREILELVWHNGQPGIQNQRLHKSSPPSKSQQQQQQHPMEQLPPPAEGDSTTQLFMQEDEMASWLHYPLEYETPFDQNLNDLLYHPPGSSSSAPEQPPANLRPPPPAPWPQFRHPAHLLTAGSTQFAHQRPRVSDPGQSASARKKEPRESTVVDSSDTPTPSVLPLSWSSVDVSGVSSGGGGGGYMTMNKDAIPYGSSVSGASATALADPMAQPPDDDRKRKGVVSADTFFTDYQGEDMEKESSEAKRQCCGTASGKRSRSAEVHNLSERKRRDRINERMKALGDLIPRCTKTDKASLLDEAIEYLKALQMQVQMMSMGNSGYVPMMYPGVQQYMPVPPMGFGMGIETRMNRPMVPYPPALAGPGYQLPAFPMPPVPPFDPSRAENNPVGPVFNPHNPQLFNMYEPYLGSQQIPAHQIPQLPGQSIPSTSKTSTSMDPEDNDNHPSDTGLHFWFSYLCGIHSRNSSYANCVISWRLKDFPGKRTTEAYKFCSVKRLITCDVVEK